MLQHHRGQATQGDHAVTAVVDGGETSTVLHGLRSETTYTVSVQPCQSVDCGAPDDASVDGATVDAATARMIWQIAGSDPGFENADPIMENTNTKGFGLYMGLDAPESVRGMSQLYYDTNVRDNKGIRMAVASEAPEDVTEVLDYLALEDQGLMREDSGDGQPSGPQTHQPVPVASGAIRMFFEGVLEGEDGDGRLFSVDSQDGWIGRDFNPGTSTDCMYEEIVTGGACEPTVVLQNETTGGPAGVRDVRQSKLVYPMFDDWIWDESAGSVIITTIHFTEAAGSCSETFFNMGVAIYDGSDWSLQMDDAGTGCPAVLPGIQAPMPAHMGLGRHMIIFSDNQEAVMDMSTDKVLKVLYVDAANTGDATLIEVADFEAREDAREVTTVWPDGTELSVEDEKKFDDYGIFSPTNDPEHLIMYANMSCDDGTICQPFIGQMGWVNP